MRLHGRRRRPLLSRRREPPADRARSVVRLGEEPRDVPPSPCPEAAGLTVQPLRSPWETKGRDRGDDGLVSVLGPGGQGTPGLGGRRRRPPGAVRYELSCREAVPPGFPGAADPGEHPGPRGVSREVGACWAPSLRTRSKGLRGTARAVRPASPGWRSKRWPL